MAVAQRTPEKGRAAGECAGKRERSEEVEDIDSDGGRIAVRVRVDPWVPPEDDGAEAVRLGIFQQITLGKTYRKLLRLPNVSASARCSEK